MATKITKKLTIQAEGKDVVLDGMDFTADGYVVITAAASVTVKNCRVYKMNVEGATKNYWLTISGDIPVKVIIENNYFGDSVGTAGSMYNLLEMNAEFLDGSSISSNYFTANVVTHNTVNVYGASEYAKIKINGNVFEISSSTVRIGVKKEPTCFIEMKNNVVKADRAGDDPRWYGLALVQPYGKQTTTFANMTITLEKNSIPGTQLIYGYSGANDTPMDETTMPTIIIDGKEATEVPIYH